MDSRAVSKREDRTITLSIETKVREFPGKILLSCLLAEKGFRVILTNNRKFKNILKEKSWLFIDRNTFASRQYFFEKLFRKNVKIACIDEEGIVWAKPEIYEGRLSKNCMKKTSLFFTWGKKQTELVNRVKENTLVIESGNPRMDLLRPELRALYQEQVEKINEEYGNFILIASNFAANNHFYTEEDKEGSSETVIELMRHQGLIKTDEDERYNRENLIHRGKVFSKMIGLVQYLNEQLPDVPIVVRPHPSENHETWRKAMKGRNNIQVVFKGELEPWIMAARSVIHNSCTSGILAALVNRTSIAFMPFHNNEFEHDFPNDVSAKAYTPEEVLELVKRSPIEQEVPEEIKEYVSSLDGPLAAEKIADKIMEAYERNIKEKKSFIAIFSNELILFFKRTKRQIFKPKKYTDVREKYKKQKLDKLTSSEVDDYIKTFGRLLNKFDNIETRNIGETVEIVLKK